jgi:hypothetical protein
VPEDPNDDDRGVISEVETMGFEPIGVIAPRMVPI